MDWDEACRQASAMVATRNYAEAEQVIYGAYNQVKAENNLEKICTSLDLLGWLCFMQSKHQQASEIYYYCAQAKVQLMGADNIEVAKTIKNIIASTYQLKQYEKVVDMARECLRIFALHLPRENPEIATLGKNLYELLKWMNRIPEAEHVKQLYLDPPPMQAQVQSGAYALPQTQQHVQQAQSGAYTVPQQQQQQPHPQQQQAYQQQQQQYAQHAAQAQQQQPPQQQQPQSSTASGNQWAQQAYVNQSQSQAQPAVQPQPQPAQNTQNQWAPQPQTQSGAYSVPQQAAQQPSQPQQQQQPASQGHFRQISIPAQNAAPAQPAPAPAPAQQQPQSAPVTDSAAKAAAARRKDYSKFAKSVCEVCKQEYEGAGCLRCTSAGIKAFDPGSTFGSEW